MLRIYKQRDSSITKPVSNTRRCGMSSLFPPVAGIMLQRIELPKGGSDVLVESKSRVPVAEECAMHTCSSVGTLMDLPQSN